MKNSNLCPKCGGAKIVRVPGEVGPYGVGNNIPAGWTIFSSVKVTRFICSDCGFSEEWIESPKDLEKLRDKYYPAPKEEEANPWGSPVSLVDPAPVLICDDCGSALVVSGEAYLCPKCSG